MARHPRQSQSSDGIFSLSSHTVFVFHVSDLGVAIDHRPGKELNRDKNKNWHQSWTMVTS
uniref:Uncharacterized protein n=1 Tax=Arundo donax TaxID=35708 RepID=A0A0A8XTN0_ARUDO